MADQCDCDNGWRYVADLYARQVAKISASEDLGRLELLARGYDRAATDDAGQPLYDDDPITGDPVPRLEHVPGDPAALERWAKYRAALNIVYPCPRCEPDKFERWRHGCFRPNHQAKSCQRCHPKAERR